MLVLAIVLGPWLFSRLTSPWRQVRVFSDVQPPRSAVKDSDSLRLACYNIAHGRGLARSNWTGESAGQRLQRLDSIANLLHEVDADVVVLNEVDFNSSWSHGVNQARYLAEKAGYRYRVEQRNLDFHVLGWSWSFGNAILSRYPVGAHVIDLPAYAFWEQVVAGKKRAVYCQVAHLRHPFGIVAAHLSHCSESVRVESAHRINRFVEPVSLPVVIAGDMNSSPTGFPLSRTTESGENAMEVFDQFHRCRRYPETPDITSAQMTFPSNDPRQIIDWILISRSWYFGEYRVEPAMHSDHRCVHALISSNSRVLTTQ